MAQKSCHRIPEITIEQGGKCCPCLSVVFSQTSDSSGPSLFQKNENAGLRVSFGNVRQQRDPTV